MLAHAVVDVGNDALGIDGDQAVDGGLDEAPVVGLRLAEPLFQFFLLGDVTGRGEHALEPALGVPEGGGVIGDHRHAPGLGERRQLVVGDLALPQHQLDAFFGPLRDR